MGNAANVYVTIVKEESYPAVYFRLRQRELMIGLSGSLWRYFVANGYLSIGILIPFSFAILIAFS